MPEGENGLGLIDHLVDFLAAFSHLKEGFGVGVVIVLSNGIRRSPGY